MLWRWSVLRMENGHVTEVVSLIERESSFYGSLKESLMEENGHVTEVAIVRAGD